MKEFCERFCTVQQPSFVNNDFLSQEEIRKIRQHRPTIRTLYRLEPPKEQTFRTALRNLDCINRILDLL